MTEKWRNDTKELAMAVSVKQDVDFDTAYAIIKAFLSEIRDRLEKGKSVKIKGFGKFTVEERKQWRKYDFTQKKVVEWDPGYTVRFRTSTTIRHSLRELRNREKKKKKKK